MRKQVSLLPLLGLRTRQDVCNLLDVSEAKLIFLLYGRPKNERYTIFSVPKRRGGLRTIMAPRDDLKMMQRRLFEQLMIYQIKKVAHAFVKGRSIVSNADRHLRCRYVLNVDLTDFFLR